MKKGMGSQFKERVAGRDSECGKGGGDQVDPDMRMEEATDEGEEEVEESRSGLKCSRCTRKGHFTARCTTKVYCVICDSNEHVNHKCQFSNNLDQWHMQLGTQCMGWVFIIYHILHCLGQERTRRWH